jgi:TRAP-type C4-dicarboxylate transport system permease small subunit
MVGTPQQPDVPAGRRVRSILEAAAGNFEEVVASTGLVLVIGITIFNIANRYLLERSGVWAPELAEMIFAWVVFLGASAAWKRNMHISIGVVVRCLGPRTRTIVGLMTDAILIIFLAYAAYLATKLTISSHSRVSPVLRVPFSYVYASAALAFSLMLIRRCVGLARSFRGRLTSYPRQA